LVLEKVPLLEVCRSKKTAPVDFWLNKVELSIKMSDLWAPIPGREGPTLSLNVEFLIVNCDSIRTMVEEPFAMLEVIEQLSMRLATRLLIRYRALPVLSTEFSVMLLPNRFKRLLLSTLIAPALSAWLSLKEHLLQLNDEESNSSIAPDCLVLVFCVKLEFTRELKAASIVSGPVFRLRLSASPVTLHFSSRTVETALFL
jgi:hypothetical protein